MRYFHLKISHNDYDIFFCCRSPVVVLNKKIMFLVTILQFIGRPRRNKQPFTTIAQCSQIAHLFTTEYKIISLLTCLLLASCIWSDSTPTILYPVLSQNIFDCCGCACLSLYLPIFIVTALAVVLVEQWNATQNMLQT